MESLELNRCSWANRSKEEMEYHDKEWGRPEFDDLRLFAMLNLEGQQAGLSWTTILRKRENFYKAYDNFDPAVIIHYDNRKIEELLQDPGIIRNRLKIKAVISNAAAYFDVINQYGSFHDFLWRYVDNTPIKNHWESLSEVPASTPLSDTISKDMKKLGFKFVGTTIIYAYMQSIGMVNDHLCDCPLHEV
ncbi:DNA-3-methyladenine glycosylase I [Anaerocolumna chitinilytica]|uniref:DNA-3-methyladenine glycosylase n=1 Tax=Anaerocolumna chitinilytica TaxID=1727145 RepID=A0A7I8DMJ8_9FIRM|nr:DNA-3-methyladenine glycosylase I [Anaerocolumna chitinilytica]BCJ99542.1 DNA-3-methyladenine glycosylase [Anaerocolumna chitinilytica]